MLESPLRVCSIVLCILALAAQLAAQKTTGELRISVHDEAAAPIPAQSELVSESAKTRQTVEFPASGSFTFKNLEFGVYRLEISSGGFASHTELIQIRNQVPQSLDVVLRVQPIATSLEVHESETLLDPNRSGMAYYISREEMQNRSAGQPGRGLIDLVAMQPGWVLEANGILHPRDSEYDTQFVVDGFPLQENRSPAFAPSFDADNIQSVKTYTGGIPAEFGNKLGGVIEVTTDRNGSPGLHGTVMAQGGSFDTAGGYAGGQYTGKKLTLSGSAEGFLTDRYLDPPTLANDTNHASGSAETGTAEYAFNDANRLRFSAAHREARFLVPNDYLQQDAGQRQDRTSEGTDGFVSYQHVFSPSVLGSVRGMVRDISASLWSNPLSTPIQAQQDRSYREGYVNGSLAGSTGIHEWKVGVEARLASIHEEFGYLITDYDLAGTPVFDDDVPPSYNFKGHAYDHEQAAYVQDTIRLRSVTVSVGVRFDHYHLLVDETAFSPRLGVAWNIQSLGLVLRASYDRIFGTPPFENLLVSAAPDVRFGEGFYLPLYPARGNYYEAGFSKSLGRHVRLDATYFRRDVRNFEDDDLLLNTGVSFPISFDNATIHGTEVKLEMPRWGKFSGFLSYTNSIGIGQLPITGGLFLDEGAADLATSHDRFAISQDVRNVARALVRYQITPRIWTAWSALYSSGLPVEDADELPDRDLLVAQFGEPVVDKVNFERGRVRPSFSLNASVGADVWRSDRMQVSLQADVTNITNQLNVINFAGLLSGTAIALPRSAGARLRFEF